MSDHGPPRVLVTGSHAYGAVGPLSDLDIVVYVTDDLFDRLRPHGDAEKGLEKGYVDLRVTVGPLDLIIVKDVEIYRAWLRGTVQCQTVRLAAGRPLTREEAVDIMERERPERKTSS